MSKIGFQSQAGTIPDFPLAVNKHPISVKFIGNALNIGLAQFVNRWLCGAEPPLSYAGCLQNAITRADVDGANLSNRSASPAPTSNSPPAFS